MFAIPLPYPYPSVGASKYACSCELAVFEGSLMSIAVVSTCKICTISHSTKLTRLNTCYAVHTRNWKTILVVRALMLVQSRYLRIRRFEGWNYGEPRWYATVGHDSKPMLGTRLKNSYHPAVIHQDPDEVRFPDNLWQHWLDTFSPSNQRIHGIRVPAIPMHPMVPALEKHSKRATPE